MIKPLEDTSPDQPLYPAKMDDPQPGERIGRYEVLGKIGAGSMGVVFRARDPDLRREVAIKLVAPEHIGGREGGEHRSRLLREARALAMLDHPNVVRVYDVGEQGDGIFLAMEYVVGTDASRWLRDERPSWEEVLAVFRAAGRGLAAAHAAGLVHRDFKPANILVGDDHRVRVTDFGLAMAPRYPCSDPAGVVGASESDASTSAEPKIVGTLAYMSPALSTGDPADVLSDQYAFFCSLWEALFGRRPFAGTQSLALQQAKAEDALTEPSDGAGVPRELVAVLRRGLLADPGRRFADMREVLEVLRHIARAQAKSVSRRAVPWWVSPVALAVVLGIAFTAAAVPSVEEDACTADPRAARLRAAYSKAIGAGSRAAASTLAAELAVVWTARGCKPLAREWAAIANSF